MSTGLWILLALLALLVAFNLLRVGVDAEYDGEALFLRVKAGPVKITVLPKKAKPPKPKKEKKKKQEKPPKEGEETPKKRRKPTVKQLLHLARLALEAAGTFRRRLQTDLLRLHLQIGGDDPYNTAMTYAYLRAALNGLAPLADSTLAIKERDVRLGTDFTAPGIRASGRLILTIRIGQIVAVALVFLFRALPTLRELLKKK